MTTSKEIYPAWIDELPEMVAMTSAEKAAWYSDTVAKAQLKDKEHNEEAKEYRRCETCDAFLTEGYVIENGSMYFCNNHEPSWWKEFIAENPDGSDDTYWTEWEYGFPEGHDATCHLDKVDKTGLGKTN